MQKIGKLHQSYVLNTTMACDVLLIIAMIIFLLKYRKTMQVMLAAFLQMNTKNTSIQSVQADQIGRAYPPLFTLNLPKEEEIIDDLREITTMDCNYCHVFLLHEMQTYSYCIQILLSIFTNFLYSMHIKTYRFICRSD